jgi:DNA topoisomerase IA
MDEKIEYSAENLIRFLKTFIEDIVDERIEVQMEMRLTSIIEQALSSVEGFDMMDHESEITALVHEVLSEVTFSVTID